MTARIDSATLVAYLDGELGHTAALRVEAALAGDPWLQQQLEALRRVDHALEAAFQPILNSPLPSLALTERPPMTTGGRPAPSWRAMRLALAAGLSTESVDPHDDVETVRMPRVSGARWSSS